MKRIDYKKVMVFILGLVIGISIGNASQADFKHSYQLGCKEIKMHYCCSSSKEGCHQHCTFYMQKVHVYKCEDENMNCFVEKRIVGRRKLAIEVRIINCHNK